MRRLLFNVGAFFAGMAPLLLVLMLLTAGMPVVSGFFTTVFLVGVGVAFSAPFVLAPPPDRGGTTVIFGPWNIILVAQLFRAVAWLGAQILDAIWTVALRALDRRDAAPRV